MPCFMRQHSAFLCGGLAFAAINDKEIVKERDCEIVFEFNMQTARTINRPATTWIRLPVQSMAASCMKRRRVGAMWKKGDAQNDVD